MLAAGTINATDRNFDIAGINETNTSITILNGNLRLTYTSEDGEYVQLVKPITVEDAIAIGDTVDISPVLEGGLGGFAQRSVGKGVAKSLTTVDWNDTSNLTTRTFTDSNGVTRTAVLLPVTLH